MSQENPFGNVSNKAEGVRASYEHMIESELNMKEPFGQIFASISNSVKEGYNEQK